MLRTTIATGLLAAALNGGMAQTGGPAEFEVASVKPAAQQPGNRFMVMMRGGPGTPDPGQITYTNVALRNLLMNAFGVKTYQISGPSWIDTERFEVAAKVPKGATKEDLKVMLQNLLTERFKLAVHREKKDMPMYALVVGKNGPKLKESAEDSPDAAGAPGPPPNGPAAEGRGPGGRDGMPPMGRGGRGMMIMINNGRLRLTGNKQTVGAMTDMLSNQLGRPVVDMTGLTGKYDYTLEFMPEEGQMIRGPMGAMPMPAPPPPGAGAGPAPAPGDSAPENSAPATLVTAVQEQLGLKLEPKKGPVDLIVIDHLEKTPTEN